MSHENKNERAGKTPEADLCGLLELQVSKARRTQITSGTGLDCYHVGLAKFGLISEAVVLSTQTPWGSARQIEVMRLGRLSGYEGDESEIPRQSALIQPRFILERKAEEETLGIFALDAASIANLVLVDDLGHYDSRITTGEIAREVYEAELMTAGEYPDILRILDFELGDVVLE